MCYYVSDKKCNYSVKIHKKLFDGWALPKHGGRAYNDPKTLQLDLGDRRGYGLGQKGRGKEGM